MNVGKYVLDEEQMNIVKDNSKYLLVVAGAGSGKTLTILGKIKYLLSKENIKNNEILCISFTKEASNSLKRKIKNELNEEINVYTFHKLALQIIKENKHKYNVVPTNTLKNIIYEYIYVESLNNKYIINQIMRYFKIKKYSKEKYLSIINDTKKIDSLILLIETFINLFKCNGYKLEDMKKILNKKKSKYKNNFLLLVLNIYMRYEAYLSDNDEIDFNDMIILATTSLTKFRNIKYVIIDEYQDTSKIRFNLIRKIVEITDSKLMVVGDDYQSIYRFTGCDISLFINFKKYFKNAKILKISNTYRNSNELVSTANKFIRKNKYQIKKNLKSKKRLKNPIKIIYYKDIKKTFESLLNKIYEENIGEILILGRNNKDINMILNNNYEFKDNKIIYLKNKNIKLKYLTIHKSKGLESDNVILINLEDNKFSLPIKIKDNKLLKYVQIRSEKYPYSEERRLFYVALTRTKNNVYLLTPYKNESIFVKEIKKYKNVKICKKN